MNSRDDAERRYLENEKLIYGALHKYFPALASDEDIQQIAGIGLWKACLNYDADKSCFSTAAYKFIKTEVLQELRKRRRRGKITTIPFTSLVCDLTTEGREELDILAISPSLDDIDWCDAETFWASLTERQQFIVKARISGLIDEEIAAELGLSRTLIIHEKKNIRQKAEETL
jgi:RNA polymerase sigma factor (sigma-70 family)